MLSATSTISMLKAAFASGYKGLLTTISSILLIFVPIKAIFFIVGGLIIYDAINGYLVSRKCGQPKIESNKLWKTILKLKNAFVLIGATYLFETFIIQTPIFHLTQIVSGIVCGTEIISLMESYCELNKDKRLTRILLKIVKAKGEKYGIHLTDEDLLPPKKEVVKKTKKTKK